MRSFIRVARPRLACLVKAQNQVQGSFCGVAVLPLIPPPLLPALLHAMLHGHADLHVTEYTYQDMTCYKIVYEDVVTPVNVPAVDLSRAAGDLRAGYGARSTDTVGLRGPVPCQVPAACPPAACETANQCIPVPAAPPMCPVNIAARWNCPAWRR